MKVSCNLAKEAIVWGRSLAIEIQEHVLSCSSCTKIAMEYASLNLALTQSLDVDVPQDFAERVMVRVLQEEKTASWSLQIGEVLQRWIRIRLVQYGLTSLAVAVALVNVLKFVMVFLLATST